MKSNKEILEEMDEMLRWDEKIKMLIPEDDGYYEGYGDDCADWGDYLACEDRKKGGWK